MSKTTGNVFRLCETGGLHRLVGVPNQDCANAAACGPIHIVQLADGMGMAERGLEAARAASKAAFDAARQTLVLDPAMRPESADVAMRAAFAAAYNALHRAARTCGWPIDEMQTTLMICGYDESSGILAYGYVGDGAIVVQSGESCFLAEQPQKGAASNATFGLLNTDMWRFGTLKCVDAVALATDGIGDCLTEGGDGGASVPNDIARWLLAIPTDIDARERDACLRDLMVPRDPAEDAQVATVFDYVGDDRSIVCVWGSRGDDAAGSPAPELAFAAGPPAAEPAPVAESEPAAAPAIVAEPESAPGSTAQPEPGAACEPAAHLGCAPVWAAHNPVDNPNQQGKLEPESAEEPQPDPDATPASRQDPASRQGGARSRTRVVIDLARIPDPVELLADQAVPMIPLVDLLDRAMADNRCLIDRLAQYSHLGMTGR